MLIDNLDQHSSVFWAIPALVEAQGFCGRYPDPTRRVAFSMTRFLALHLLVCEGQALYADCHMLRRANSQAPLDQRGDSSVPCVSFTSKSMSTVRRCNPTLKCKVLAVKKLELTDAAQRQPPHKAQLC